MMFRSCLVAAVVTVAVLAPSSSRAFAQEARVPTPGRTAQAVPPQNFAQPQVSPQMVVGDFDADQTRQQLYELLGKYPPALGRVLKLDPSLMTSEAYLATYPALAAFLGQHPEIARSPAFFLERISMGGYGGEVMDQQSIRRREMAEMLAGMAAFVVFLVVTGVIVWVVRTVIDHRRWNRVSKTQFDVHSKLLERMTTNEELLAYIQTPVGRRFLESGPAPLPGEARPVDAPFSRILWSVQVGIVLLTAGAGLMFLSMRVASDLAVFFTVFGVVTLALGVGFIASGAAAYGLSKRLGLLGRNDVDHA